MAKAYSLLDVYDTSDWIGRRQGYRHGSDVYSLEAKGTRQLVNALNQMVKDGLTFKKAVFTTHGHPGGIWLNEDFLTAYTLYKEFNGGHYESLFPHPETKLYFDGCSVADGEDGWKFLEAAVRTFCRRAGGYAFGWTSTGFGMFSFLPGIGGHTVHITGRTRYVFLIPAEDGGAYINRFDPENQG